MMDATSLATAGISAGGNIAGSLITGAFNASQSGKARHWSEKMYNQRYQRTMADMKAAGLNPILAANGGQVGSVPGAQTATMPDMGDDISGGMATAIALKLQKQESRSREQVLESDKIDLEMKRKMYDWLQKNPQYSDLVYSGMISKEAGMNSNITAPVMAWNSATIAEKVGGIVDWLKEHVVRPNPFSAANRATSGKEAKRDSEVYINGRRSPIGGARVADPSDVGRR